MHKNPKNRRFIISLLIIGVVLMSGINIVLSATLADAGSRILDLDTQQAKLETAIANLERQSTHSLALTDLQQAAAGLGFSTDVTYIEIPGQKPLAFAQPGL